jgi:hypothetical protein
LVVIYNYTGDARTQEGQFYVAWQQFTAKILLLAGARDADLL